MFSCAETLSVVLSEFKSVSAYVRPMSVTCSTVFTLPDEHAAAFFRRKIHGPAQGLLIHIN